jgi:hypothetical protein
MAKALEEVFVGRVRVGMFIKAHVVNDNSQYGVTGADALIVG